MRLKLFISLLVVAVLSSNVKAGPFNEGSVGLGIVLGQGTAFNDTYDIYGIGIGYYVVDGLELGLDYEVWSGGSPAIRQYSPKLNYVFSPNSDASLYLGGFYRLTEIDGLPDDEAIGARLGLYLRSGKRAFLGFGVAMIEYQDCVETPTNTCTDTYPEITVGFTL